MSAWSEWLGVSAPVVEFLTKAAVLWLLGWCAMFFARRSSAATREMLWRAVCLGVLSLPILATLVPAWSLELLPARSGSAPLLVAAEAVDGAAVRPDRRALEGPFAQAESSLGASDGAASSTLVDPAVTTHGASPIPAIVRFTTNSGR